MSYASAFRTTYLLGRSIEYQEGNPLEAYQTTVDVIQEVKKFASEKLFFEKFLDELMQACEHREREQYAQQI